MPEQRFFFDQGLTLHTVCAGDEVRNLRFLQNRFPVKLISRENWVEISGDEDAVVRVNAFFEELVRFCKLRGRQIENRDFEFLCRTFIGRTEADLPALWEARIAVSPKKPEILPRSRRQLEYVRNMRRQEMVFGIGPAGTGKTYLAMAMAVSEFLKGHVSRIVLTRPARESGENLGFLPGSLEEKIMPYLRPLYDALYDMLTREEATDLIERNIIEIAPLAFMRGRTLNSSFIILDEAQNTTSDQMLMFLTRMGFNSRCVITGDPMQSDLTGRESSGLARAITTLRELPEIGFTFFETSDVMRNSLIEKIITNYGKEEPKKELQQK